MESLRIYDGSQPEDPLFTVHLCAMRGPRAERVTVAALPREREGKPALAASDVAVEKVLRARRAPESAFLAVYIADPLPRVGGTYGAPMGRVGGNMDPDGEHYRAQVVRLDSEGYDKGGAYWGHRPHGLRLYVVQDGMGNRTFVDAPDRARAIAIAKGDS